MIRNKVTLQAKPLYAVMACILLSNCTMAQMDEYLATQPTTPREVPPSHREVFIYIPGENCGLENTPAGWEVQCPRVMDERRRSNAIDRKAPSILGHASNYKMLPNLVAKGGKRQGYPTTCGAARKNFSAHATKFIAFTLREDRKDEWNSLSRRASYNTRELATSYSHTVDNQARVKLLYADSNYDGDAECTKHFQGGINELKRIAQIIIDELNKGNRDLKGTGLNPYAP